MFMTRSDERIANPELSGEIDEVYEKHFFVKQRYNQRFNYDNAERYGFVDREYYEWSHERTLTSEEYISYIGTNCEHITLEEPYRTAYYSGIKNVMSEYG